MASGPGSFLVPDQQGLLILSQGQVSEFPSWGARCAAFQVIFFCRVELILAQLGI